MGQLHAGVYAATSEPYKERHPRERTADLCYMLCPCGIHTFYMWGGELTDPLERTLGKPWTLFLEEKHRHTKILTLKPVHVPLCRPHMQQINLIFCATSQNSVKWKKVRVLGR